MAPFKHPGCTHNFEPPRAAAAAAVCTLSGGAPGPGSPWPPHAAPGGAQLHGGMAWAVDEACAPHQVARSAGRTAPPTPEATVGSGRSAGRTCGRTTAAVGGPPEATAWVACVSAAAESGSGSGARCRCSSAAGIGAVYADFAGNEHEVGAADWACLKLRSKRKSDGEVVGLQFTGDDVADHTCRSTLQASLGRK